MKPVLTLIMGFYTTMILFGMDHPDNSRPISEFSGKDAQVMSLLSGRTLPQEDSGTFRKCDYQKDSMQSELEATSESPMVCSDNTINPTTCFNYSVPKASFVSLTIYDLLGRRVRKLMDEYQTPGVYSGQWDGLDDACYRVPCGVYVLSIKAAGYSANHQFMLVR